MNKKLITYTKNIFCRGLFSCLVAVVFAFMPIVAESATETVILRELHVVTTPAGAAVFIDGNSKGRTPVTVSLPDAKPHLLDITKNGYSSVRRTVIVGDGQKIPVDISLDVVLGLALVRSTPAAASIRINGIDRGKTPLLVTDLPVGSYSVHVTAPGYLKKDLQLVMKDRIPVEVNAELVSDAAGLKIASTPVGASVIINGAVQGVTPCDLPRIPGGECNLVVKLDGYAEYKQMLRLVAGKSESLNITLNAMPSSLRVVTTPISAKVYINDQFKGEAPYSIKNLQPGSYKVRVELKGHDLIERDIELKRGDKLIEEFAMVANVGALEITTEPAGAKIFVDGKWLGFTISKPDQTDKVSETLTLAGIPSGSHELKIFVKGYYLNESTINIARDQTTIEHIVLKRRFIPNCEVRTATEVYQGVLVQVDPAGNIKLEVNPGIMKVIRADELISRRPLREEDLK